MPTEKSNSYPALEEQIEGTALTAKFEVADHDDASGEKNVTWARHLEYILCALGGCVGLGNLWRFPYLCMRNGGGAFLIPYVFFIIVCAIPLIFLESTLGQYSGKGFIACWSVCPLFKGVGYLVLLMDTVWLSYIGVVSSWSLYYLGSSFTATVPWATCNNSWNTPACADKAITPISAFNLSTTLGNFTHQNFSYQNTNQTASRSHITILSPTEEFWENKVLQLSKGVDYSGSIRWELLACLAATWIIAVCCIIKGIRTSGKVAYVTATAPYILLVVLMVRGATLPGAIDGIKFYIVPDFVKLAQVKVWAEAALQVFYSLVVGFGMYTSLAKFNKFSNNCARDAILMPILCASSSIFGGFVVFSSIGFIAKRQGVTVLEIARTGPGLAFVAYPEALRQLPIAPLWSVLFYLMMLSLGIDSQFVVIENIITSLSDISSLLAAHKVLGTIFFGVIMFLMGIPYVTQGGFYLLTFMDWYCWLYTPFVVSLLLCVAVGWVYGASRMSNNIKIMTGRTTGRLWKICWLFIIPVTLLFVIGFNIYSLSPANYGNYKYPRHTIQIGHCLSTLPLLVLPGIMVYQIIMQRGSIEQRMKQLITPSQEWDERRIRESINKPTGETSQKEDTCN